MLKGSTLKYIILFILLVLLQVLVLNRISFLGYAVPFLYIYFILKLPIGCNRNLVLVIGFLIGFVIDIFCNTLGMNAAASTFIAFICRPVQKLFFMVDDYDEQVPSLRLLGASFMKYAILMTFIHHVILISLESFSYFNLKMIVLRILSSTLLTSILIFAFEGFSTKKRKLWEKQT